MWPWTRPAGLSTGWSTTSRELGWLGPGLKAYLDEKIRGCIANVLHMGAEDVDSKAALSDLGIDSVMTASLRQEMQKTLKVKVPPILTWSYPTVGHLVGWFAEKVGN